MNQHYFDVPFAFAGDVTAIPDPLQVGGTVSFTEGWNFNYQRNLSTDPAALPIDRSTMNWLLKQITTAIQAIQQTGVPEFITSAQNGGVVFSYGKGSAVLWSASGNAPFGKYVSLTAGNTNTPSAGDPQGLTTGWQIEVDPISTAAQATAGTDDASIMTPLKVAQQTALRALLAGNATQVFNVGPATSATHAAEFSQVVGVVGTTRNLSMDIAAASATGTLTADEVIVESTLGGLRYEIANFNKTINLATVGANGMDTGTAPISGYIALYAILNTTSGAYALLATNATSAKAPQVYGGANMPSGYTASALVAVIPTNASQQFQPGYQIDRTWFYISGVSIYNANAVVAAWTAQSAIAAIPQNARLVGGNINVSNTVSNATGAASIAGGATGLGVKQFSVVISTGGQAWGANFDNVPVRTPQTLYIAVSAGTGTPGANFIIQNYTI